MRAHAPPAPSAPPGAPSATSGCPACTNPPASCGLCSYNVYNATLCQPPTQASATMSMEVERDAQPPVEGNTSVSNQVPAKTTDNRTLAQLNALVHDASCCILYRVACQCTV